MLPDYGECIMGTTTQCFWEMSLRTDEFLPRSLLFAVNIIMQYAQ